MHDLGQAGSLVVIDDRMQQGHRYLLDAPEGRGFHPVFQPDPIPREMLELGLFCGVYLRDCRQEYPASWFARAKLAPNRTDPSINHLGVRAGDPLSEWRAKGWIHPYDARGWFQWYCRYFAGRRVPGEDERQIARWRAFRRHAKQVRRNCEPGDPFCRPRQHQALLQWAYESRIL